jgi:hypothetical protein
MTAFYCNAHYLGRMNSSNPHILPKLRFNNDQFRSGSSMITEG